MNNGTKICLNLFALSIVIASRRSRNTLGLMKTQVSFEIRAYIKGRVNLSGSKIYNELCQIHRTSTVPKLIVFRWQKKFEDGFTYFKDGSRPGQPKTVVINANIDAVAGLIKRDFRLSVKYIAHSVGISSGSAHDILTQQLKLRKV